MIGVVATISAAVLVQAVSLNLTSVLIAIFTTGFVGFITVLVTSYRRLKSGKIVDDESIIQRQLRELKRKDERIDELETEVTTERREKNRALDDVAVLRRQLIGEGINPSTSRTRAPRPEEGQP